MTRSRSKTHVGLFSLLLTGALACGGGGTDPDPEPKPKPDPVATALSVTPEDASVPDGATRQLTGTVTDQNGAAMTGSTVSWTTRDAAVASVDANGLVTALRPGTVWIHGSAGALADSARVTVTTVPANLTIVGSPDRAGTSGRTVADSLAVRVTDRHGTAVPGIHVTFTASGAGSILPSTPVPTGADGIARAAWRLGSPGEQTVTATAGAVPGAMATFRATATPPVPGTLVVTPDFATVTPGGVQSYLSVVTSTDGDLMPNLQVAYTSLNPGVALSAGGPAMRGVMPGVARIVASVGPVVDTVTLAVLAPNSILGTAFPGATFEASAQRGDTVRVPVILDLSRASPNGDLGSVQLDVFYAAALQFVRVQDELGGSVGQLREPGRYSIAFAAAQPQGTGTIRLATLVLVVRGTAQPGTAASLGLQVTEAPRTTSFAELTAPVVVGGRVRIR